mgnify:CR=1 FL=1
MNNKRITLFAGHYGSGKTNIAVNYALWLKEENEKVVIADLDIVNPYFRSKDSEKHLEEICKRLSGKDDTWYATNMEIYEYVTAYNSLVFYADNSAVYNPSPYEIFLLADGVNLSVKPYETLRF